MKSEKNIKETYIYALMDGDSVRYIGKSNNPDDRKNKHILEARLGGTTHKCNWINKMLSDNKEITLQIIETVPNDQWEEREKYWINYYGLENLVNETIGGIGKEYSKTNNNKRKIIDRSKNLKITPNTHKILKDYCEDNGLKMFAFVESLIKAHCQKPKDIYGDDK